MQFRLRAKPSPIRLLALSSGLGLYLGATSALANPIVPPATSSLRLAQSSIDFGEIRALGAAKNYARQVGEAANGGLNVYRAEDAMHGPSEDAPYQDVGDSWIFTFKGRSPSSSTYNLETEVEVVKDTLETKVLYNGPIRLTEQPWPSTSSTGGQSLPLSDSAVIERPVGANERPIEFASESGIDSAALAEADRFNTAKNYARQAAEKANGGLGAYRAEDVMHGPAAETPHQETDTAWIFTFRGGAPGEGTYSVESDVSVDKTSLDTTVIYNGPLR